MKEKTAFGYYVVIPTQLLMDSKITAQAKLLYGVVANLCNKYGYCFCTNEYIAELLQCHKSTISRQVNELLEAGYLKAETVPTKTGTERRLWLNLPRHRQVGKNVHGVEGDTQKCVEGGTQKCVEGGTQKCEAPPSDSLFIINNNNINNINTDKNVNKNDKDHYLSAEQAFNEWKSDELFVEELKRLFTTYSQRISDIELGKLFKKFLLVEFKEPVFKTELKLHLKRWINKRLYEQTEKQKS